MPDFAALFPRPTDPDDWNLEPRHAYALWYAFGPIIDQLSHDLEAIERGDGSFESGIQLSRLPIMTWNQDADWVRNLIQSAFDLLGALEKGEVPFPRNTAEEVLLSLAIEDAKGYVADILPEYDEWTALPELGESLNEVGDLLEILYQDNDFMMLYDASMDGIEDEMPLLVASGWFKWFSATETRTR